jgi:hypothetical protein
MNKWKILAEVVILLCIFSYVGAEPLGGALKVLDNGNIEGIVRWGMEDANRLPNVRVITFDSLDMAISDDTTDSSGSYNVSLTPGVYRELFSKIGYMSRNINDIVIAENETTHVNTVLGINGCTYYLGDINGSYSINGLDVVYAVSYFKGGPQPPHYCICIPGLTPYLQGDVNGTCTFDGIDVTYMVSYFKGGGPLHPCPDCPPVLRKLN